MSRLRRLLELIAVFAVPVLSAVLGAPLAIADDPRDLVFECPCGAEWAPGNDGKTGKLTLTFGVRNHGDTLSGELFLRPIYQLNGHVTLVAEDTFFGSVPAGAELTSQQRTIAFGVRPPDAGELIRIELIEKESGHRSLRRELLTMWPVADDGPFDSLRFVDILTDSDGDGVSDVNENLTGVSPVDASDVPGVSTIDVLVLYDEPLPDYYDDYPFTRLHHVMVLANMAYADSGTNIRLRTVAMREVEELGLELNYEEMMEPVGADLMLGVWADDFNPCGRFAGCAALGSAFNRGFWRYQPALVSHRAGALTAAHELGHVMGLVHSARQGEALGAFRWSRGHYLQGDPGNHTDLGTIMTYGVWFGLGVFSNPEARCGGRPCGAPIDMPGGANAVKSLDLLRFQVAARRAPVPDTDGDGFVDPADQVPDDPRDWLDFDGDDIGDNVDEDDDNDGIADADDAFPLDPKEWEDRDDDGVGDNADDDIQVSDPSPFKDIWLRRAVERELGISTGAPIPPDLLGILFRLDAAGLGIRDLSGLEGATNLSTLYLAANPIVDISPLSGLANLDYLDLRRNFVIDLSPLSQLTELEQLNLGRNAIVDLSPLSQLTNLKELNLDDNAIVDLSPLSQLTGLERLDLGHNAIVDLSPLSTLNNLWKLDLVDNAISNLAPLSTLTTLKELYLGQVWTDGIDDWEYVGGNAISDLSPLSDLTRLEKLHLAGNAISDLSSLSGLINIYDLDLRANVAADLSPLAGSDRNYRTLYLGGNAITNVSPLSGLTGLERLDLSSNAVSDITPLNNESIWAEAVYRYLDLRYNPLDDASVDVQIPALESMGVSVRYWRASAFLPDPALRRLVAKVSARNEFKIDDPEGYVRGIIRLEAFAAGISDLTGIDQIQGLEVLYLAANTVTEIAALANLSQLSTVDLTDNRVSDISPLVDNLELGDGDWISLNGNPLSEESLNAHIPELLKRGVEVDLDYLSVSVIAGEEMSFDTSGYFNAVLGAGVRMDVVVSDQALARANIIDGVLTVTPGAAGRTVTVSVAAINDNEATAALSFRVKVKGVAVPMFPTASDPVRQGFVRVINHSRRPGEARIQAIDDAGARRGPIALAVGAGEVIHFNSRDLELGNADKGLSAGVGAGEGDWRLEVESDLDLDVLSYIRTADGFLTSMHDLPPLTETGQHIAIFNPGGNRNQVSLLRLINPGEEETEVSIVGVDSSGASPGSPVTLTLNAGTARTVSAQELESGEGLAGALGDGEGKWWLDVAADKPVVALSLLRSPTGHLTNLSRLPNNKALLDDGATVHHVPVFLSAADPKGRQGFVRVVNRGVSDTMVRINAQDDTDFVYDGLELTVPAGGASHFNSNDLEVGNAGKGLSGATGAGEGDWRLTLTSAADVDVLAYIRTEDGFLTSMHDTVPSTARGHAVPIFNPADNRNQVSFLRIANRGSDVASVTVRGIDDLGTTRGDDVAMSVPAGRSRTISALVLEQGGDDSSGRMGDGAGKWRLSIFSDQPLQVTNLLESPTGHLSNLSRAVGAADDMALSPAQEDSRTVSDFPDSALRAVIETALQKMPGEPILPADLASLTTLNGLGQGIQDLTGIHQATALEELNLGRNAISDLSPLAGMTGIKHLDLQFNAVSDISPLSRLTGLEHLDLTGNAIANLSPLTELRNLETLYLGNNAVSDASPLSGLAGLKQLSLSGNAIADLSPLAGLTELQSLEIHSNAISDLSPLTNLIELQTLIADNNAISDLSPLAGLTRLEQLLLTRNPISDLSPLSGLSLQRLYVGYTNVTLPDIVALPYFRELDGLGLSGLGIMNISALRDLNNATFVRLNDNLISDVSPLGSLTGLWQLELRGNAVEDIDPLAVRSLWDDFALEIRRAVLDVQNNPLNRTSIDEHIETLRSWGVNVRSNASH